MNSEDDLLGKPLSDVPQRDPDSDCNARRSTERDGTRVFVGYCGRTSGWGTDSDDGRCRTHGGAGGAPTGEANGAYEHGLYSADLDDDDVARLDALADVDDLEKLDHLIDFETMRVLRAEGLVEDPALEPHYVCRHCGADLPTDEIATCPNCERPVDDPVVSYQELHLKDGPLAQRAQTVARLIDTRSKVQHRRDKIEKGEKVRADVDGSYSLDEETRTALREALRARRGDE
jgi:hypothetical protein